MPFEYTPIGTRGPNSTFPLMMWGDEVAYVLTPGYLERTGFESEMQETINLVASDTDLPINSSDVEV